MTKLISSYDSEDIYRLDMLNKSFARIKTPDFSFFNHTSVQVKNDVYAISFRKTLVTQIQNLLDAGKSVLLTELDSLNQ